MLKKGKCRAIILEVGGGGGGGGGGWGGGGGGGGELEGNLSPLLYAKIF